MTREAFQAFAKEKLLFMDGATGSNLLKRGMPYGVCTELWVSEHKDVLIQLQREYLQVGSNIVYAPTFSGNRVKLKEYGLLDQIVELNHKLVAISKEAVQGKALVAGDITMTGAQLEPMGDMTFDELVEIYEEQITILRDAGVDLIAVETMMSLQETRAAVIAAKNVCDLPIIATLSFKENGKTLYGVSASSAVVVLQELGVDAVGINCSVGPDKMIAVIKEMKKYARIPLIAKPNAGMPKLAADGTTEYDMQAEEFAAHVVELVKHGANIVGGCCGSTPEFIAREHEALEGVETLAPNAKEGVYLASEREVFYFKEGQDVEVGREIDFAKNVDLIDEYLEDTYDTAMDLAFDMMDDEVDLISIKTAAEDITEAPAMLAIAEELSRCVNVPFVMDTSSPEVIEYVLKHYSGIMAIKQSHNQEEWETQIIGIAQRYHIPVVTIDNKIIYC